MPSNPFSRKSSFSKRRYNKRTTKRRLTRWRNINRERARFLRKLDEFRSRLLPGAKDTLIWPEYKLKWQLAKGICKYCGKSFPKLEIDHVVPLSKGGDNSFENIDLCCRKCNASKGSKLLSEWTGSSGAADVLTDAGLTEILPTNSVGNTQIKETQDE